MRHERLPTPDDGTAGRKERLPTLTLMLGNVINGLSVLAPAGMLGELAAGLSVGIHETGLLLTYGAIVLCLGSPLLAWATTRIDRRTLLTATVAVMALGHAASAFAPNYATLLSIRLAMLAVVAIYTAQAASTIALIASDRTRAGAISLVLLGWSLCVAAGLPLVTFLAMHIGWRGTFGAIAVLAVPVLALHLIGLPRGLYGTPLVLKDWGVIARNRTLLVLFATILLCTSGYFAILPFLGPLLETLAAAPPSLVAGFFALAGVAGFVGNVIATRIVRPIGTFKTALVFMGAMVLGTIIWSFSGSALPLLGIAVGFLGLGFVAFNSMQQARLVAAAPSLSSATIALNSSWIYVGQAVGSGVASILLARGAPGVVGYVAAVFMLATLGLMLATARREGAR